MIVQRQRAFPSLMVVLLDSLRPGYPFWGIDYTVKDFDKFLPCNLSNGKAWFLLCCCNGQSLGLRINRRARKFFALPDRSWVRFMASISSLGSTAGISGEQLQFTILNIGNEDAGAFTTQVYFDLRTEDRPTVGRHAIQTPYLEAGGSVYESVGVPSECFSQDGPIEERGCHVFVHADSKGEVKETDEKNNSWPF